MPNKVHVHKYTVETVESGQRRRYGDSYYHYKVESAKDEASVKNFCMHVLKNSYQKDEMPNPFAGHCTLFKKITNNNEGVKLPESRKSETYEYKVTCLSTH